MTISKSYQPADIETKWYDKWMEKGFFRSTPDEREPFTIVIPPIFATQLPEPYRKSATATKPFTDGSCE